MNKFLPIALPIFLLFALTACRQETTSQEVGIVEANTAYRTHFGAPPEVRAGKAYARVVFLPLRDDPARVSAIPIYLYNEQQQLERILSWLTGGNATLPANSPMYDPFPAGTEVRIISHDDQVLTLAIEPPPESNDNWQPMLSALIETTAQFDDVNVVYISINGQSDEALPKTGYRHDPSRIAEVLPPTLVSIAGSWDEGEEDPEEISVNFDRPVTVNTFQLSYPDGNKVAGEYFTSSFNMSVVIHPDDPESFQENIRLKADWEVTDALGRTGRGNTIRPLKKVIHETGLGTFGRQ